jgi:hypothetical protein
VARLPSERPRPGRRALLTLTAALGAAVAATLALDQWRAAEKRREFTAPPPDPRLLTSPDLASWRVAPLPPGSLAPDFDLVDVRTGEQVSLSEFRGRPVVLLLSSYG